MTTHDARRGETPRGVLTPAAIVEAATRLADSEGLEAVSIRRVAAELDARPMSLYSRFASKREMLAAMVDAGVGEMLAHEPLPDDWREAMAVTARKMFAAYARHPWMLLITLDLHPPGANALRLAKQMARALAPLGLEPERMWDLQGIVNDYVVGYAFRSFGTVDPDHMEAAIAPKDVVELPELAALPDNLRNRSTIERFELGLRTVLDGIEQRLKEEAPRRGASA